MSLDALPKKFIYLLIVLLAWLNISHHATAQDVLTEEEAIETKSDVDVWLSPERDLDSQIRDGERGWFSKNKWWVLLGGIVIAGLSGIIASNGDGESENAGSGNYIGRW